MCWSMRRCGVVFLLFAIDDVKMLHNNTHSESIPIHVTQPRCRHRTKRSSISCAGFRSSTPTTSGSTWKRSKSAWLRMQCGLPLFRAFAGLGACKLPFCAPHDGNVCWCCMKGDSLLSVACRCCRVCRRNTVDDAECIQLITKVRSSSPEPWDVVSHPKQRG